MEILGWSLIGVGLLALVVVSIVKVSLISIKVKKQSIKDLNKSQSFLQKNINYFMFFIPVLVIGIGLIINFGSIQL